MRVSTSEGTVHEKAASKKKKSVCEERDLGVLVDTTLKFSHRCAKVVSEANRTLDMIKRSFTISVAKYLSTKVLKYILKYF